MGASQAAVRFSALKPQQLAGGIVMKTRKAAWLLIPVLEFAAVRTAFAFSDNELHAIYTSMQLKRAIHCGMTFEHLRDKYRGCLLALHCDASWVSVRKDGVCTDRLIFENVGEREPAIILNGKRFLREVIIPPKRKDVPS